MTAKDVLDHFEKLLRDNNGKSHVQILVLVAKEVRRLQREVEGEKKSKGVLPLCTRCVEAVEPTHGLVLGDDGLLYHHLCWLSKHGADNEEFAYIPSAERAVFLKRYAKERRLPSPDVIRRMFERRQRADEIMGPGNLSGG